jgi:hypothetical protein
LGEVLTVAVVPMLSDEFRCSRCFLVLHRSQLAVGGRRRSCVRIDPSGYQHDTAGAPSPGELMDRCWAGGCRCRW